MNIIRSHMDELPNGITEVSKEQLDQVPVAAPEFLQECKATAEKYEKGKHMKDDLISRKSLYKKLCLDINGNRIPDHDVDNFPVTLFLKNVKQAFYREPAAYNAEKVIEQLEELRDRFTVEDYHIRGIIEKAIEIVRKGGVE